MKTGTRVGSYEITGSLGAGGMGEVYRARDTRLNRDVAIKVLPDLFASDVERLSRFEREAQVLASLNHPHIAQVYGVIDAPAALVMELVEGEDLSQRLSRGALPIRESLEIARQVADALAAAHEKGIVHRDLKPANIKLRDDGTVKVLDFGLAKGVSPSSGSAPAYSPAHSPTITSPAAMTQMGVILGTAAYMAPEQAKGKPVDRGADMWALGAVVYEMLTGKAAFDGETVTDVLAAIVTRDADWSLLPPDTPPSMQRLLRRCLERDRRKRLADAGEARFQIEEALADPSPASPAAVTGRATAVRGRVILPWAIAAVLLIALAALAWRAWQPAAVPVVRYSLEVPPGASLILTSRPAVAVSPDGSTVIFSATSDGVERLYSRRLDSFEAEALAGTEGGSHPVISPDGRWLAFTTITKLSKIPLSGGPVQPLADVNDPRGLSWDSDDSIIYTPTTLGGVVRIPAGGGTPVEITTTTPRVERTHRWPQELPDGNAVIYTVGSFASPDNYDDASIQAFMKGTGERRTILAGAAMARYVPPGHLLFQKGMTLFAVPFDARKVEVTGTAVAVLHGVAADSTTGAAHFAWSRAGTIVYVSSKSEAVLLPMDVDRAGNAQPLAMAPGVYSDLAISPDGQQIAVSLVRGGNRDIWVYHRQRKTFTRMTFAGQNVTPVWSRDGAMLYYIAHDPTESASSIYRRPSDGRQEAELVVTVPQRTYLGALTPDQKSAVVELVTAGPSASDIHLISLAKTAKPTPLVATRFNEYGSRLSPDGRWLAYLSTESSRPEVYVRASSGSGGRWQISTEGGEEPKWSRDGRELYYRYGNVLMVAKVGNGTVFETSTPVRMFSGIYNLRNESGLSYDVDPLTGRFVMIRLGDERGATPTLRLITNWIRELAAAK